MSVEEIKETVRLGILSEFQNVSVAFDQCADDPNSIGVGVFGVEKGCVRHVKDLIHEFDWKLCAGRGLVLIPRVRDFKTTQEYYPHLLPTTIASQELAITIAAQQINKLLCPRPEVSKP